MELDLYQVDAFASKAFSGNPACVMPLTHWLNDEVMLNIAKENAVADACPQTEPQAEAETSA